MERKKPKLLVIGHARHGKDTFADLLVKAMNLAFVSSSEFVGRRAVWPSWGEERYLSYDEMYEDRVNFRSTWYNLIEAYNTPDKSRTGTEMMADFDIYVGMRNTSEFKACVDKDLFDYVIWVDASARLPLEGKDSNQMTKEMADIWIDNNGPEINLQIAANNLQKRLYHEGYDVNYTPMPGEPTEGEAFIAAMKKDVETSKMGKFLKMPIPEVVEDIGGQNCPEAHGEPLEPVYGSMPEPYGLEEEATKCNGDCGCEDGSLCHENVCGPRSKMIVNPTLEESRKFHNDALMAQCPSDMALKTATVLDPKFTAVEDNSLSVGEEIAEALSSYKEYSGNFPDGTKKPFRVLPDGEKWVDADWHESAKNLEWEDAPEGATKVLDHGFFKVLGVMGTDQAIVEAARMSYGRGTKPVSNSQGLINYLVRHKHTSPLEMCEIKFHLRMPIFVMRQWVRHRTANLNEYSGRYSEMVRLFYVPELEQICVQDKVNKQGSAEPMSEPNACMVRKIIEKSSNDSFDIYEQLLRLGVSRETARIILPLNTYTEVVWKLDISNLIKFLALRDDSHAQWEIRQYAKLVSKAVEEHFPLVFAAYAEARQSKTLSMDEIRGLITGDYDNLSTSQTSMISGLRHDCIF